MAQPKRSNRRKKSDFNPETGLVLKNFAYAKKELNLSDEQAFLFLVVTFSGGKEKAKTLAPGEILRRTNIIVDIVNSSIENARLHTQPGGTPGISTADTE